MLWAMTLTGTAAAIAEASKMFAKIFMTVSFSFNGKTVRVL